MQEEEEEVEMEEEEEVVMVGQKPTVMVPRHINKRALKNRGLSVAFNDKELKDFVTGFHKRKKKRRKEAQRQLQEKERLKRIEARKKVCFEMYSKDPNTSGLEPDNTDNDHEEDELEIKASVSETKTYEDGCTTITVTTSEISCDGDENLRPKHVIPKPSNKSEKNHSLGVKKNPLKRSSSKHKPHRKGRSHVLQNNKRKSRRGKKR
ncbi:hypothetical protein ACMD2_01626 [Ananas comosus]|uniref:Ribosomal RNA-processing protein 17 n=1 Tax=Ananas comosus TaxID=4615 RepID=A0A199VYG9_ANACO|nr:hypothetical protein ACMD2_01626 [Ananas comosus]